MLALPCAHDPRTERRQGASTAIGLESGERLGLPKLDGISFMSQRMPKQGPRREWQILTPGTNWFINFISTEPAASTHVRVRIRSPASEAFFQMTFAVGPFFLGRPTPAERQAVERRIPKLSTNFPMVGITQNGEGLEKRPEVKGWTVDRTRTKVGEGKDAYRRASDAVLGWRNFDFGWTFTNAPAVKKDAPVVVTAQTFFLWSCNPLKVTWVEKDGGPKSKADKARLKRRMSFGHATLEGHQIAGEESFAVELDKNNNVWYEILTVSRPATPIAILSAPLLRFFQLQFMSQSMKAVTDAAAGK